MKKKYIAYIYVTFILFSYKGLFAQDYILNITSKSNQEILILNKIDFKKKHKDSILLKTEIDKISTYLKSIGYFSNTLDSIKKTDKVFTQYFSLNKKVETASVKINSDLRVISKYTKVTNNSFIISIKKLQPLLATITKELGKQGKSFSKVQLQNIIIKEDTLFADLEINQSKKRIINNIIIKGYEDFPKSYLKNYFNIQSNTVFNQQVIKKISKLSKSIPFIKEIKTPEVLFTKDSTQLYLYLKKQSNNSIDAIVSFASKENGNLLFNGNVNLKLHNILNTGEHFKLFWNSIGEERQEFNLSTEIRYIFKTPVTSEIVFNIYKQDSTFINTKLNLNFRYNINERLSLGIGYVSKSSENLQNINTINTESFDSNYFGINSTYRVPKNDFFFNDKFFLNISPYLGSRKNNNSNSAQFKINTTVSYIWDLNARNSIYVKNKTGILNSDTYLNNELFRIGGANSIRGFNEQSIFAENFTIFNLEYRFSTSDKSFLYSITDFSRTKNANNKNNLLGIGFGYLFTTKNSQINLSASIGKTNDTPFNFKNTQFIISWLNYF